MALRPRGLRRPPSNGDPTLTSYLDELRQAIEGLPFSYFSTTDGPNVSNVSAPRGTLGIEINSSATTVLWIKEGGSHQTGWASVATKP